MAGKSKSKVFYTINCTIHGFQEKGQTTKWVKVAAPENKSQRLNAGCPTCKQLKKFAERLEKA